MSVYTIIGNKNGFPKEVMKNITVLKLVNTSFTKLPHNFNELFPNLLELHIIGKNFNDILALSGHEKLTFIKCKNCSISELPTNLRNLLKLDLELNDIKQLDFEFINKNYPSLKLLNLNRNILKEINWASIQQLEQLFLSSCGIEIIDENIIFSSLVNLDVSRNLINGLKNIKGMFPVLEKLNLSKNLIKYIDFEHDKLEELNLLDNDIYSFKNLFCENLEKFNFDCLKFKPEKEFAKLIASVSDTKFGFEFLMAASIFNNFNNPKLSIVSMCVYSARSTRAKKARNLLLLSTISKYIHEINIDLGLIEFKDLIAEKKDSYYELKNKMDPMKKEIYCYNDKEKNFNIENVDRIINEYEISDEMKNLIRNTIIAKNIYENDIEKVKDLIKLKQKAKVEKLELDNLIIKQNDLLMKLLKEEDIEKLEEVQKKIKSPKLKFRTSIYKK